MDDGEYSKFNAFVAKRPKENFSEGCSEMEEERPTCPYCGKPMNRWRTPSMTTWESEFMFVCFNDECSYYVRGWKWMMEKYEVCCSYRHRYDPHTGEKGPLPVWSPTALKDGIID